MDQLSTIQQIAVWSLPIILAITLHEAAHAFAAYKFGDNTAKNEGRLSLNPIKHIDPIGTVALPVILLVLNTGFIFGWAKPVPVNWFNLHNPRRDMALVAIAGPLANLFMAIFWIIILAIGLLLSSNYPQAEYLIYTGNAGIIINLIFMILNLLPILPLDGGRVLNSLLPPPLAEKYSLSEPYGLFILIALLFSGALTAVLWPVISFLYDNSIQIVAYLIL
jgi:Zn-dependent protease